MNELVAFLDWWLYPYHAVGFLFWCFVQGTRGLQLHWQQLLGALLWPLTLTICVGHGYRRVKQRLDRGY